VDARGEHARDVWVLQPRQRLCLDAEAALRRRAEPLGSHEFQRDLAPRKVFGGGVHHAHAAESDQAFDGAAADGRTDHA